MLSNEVNTKITRQFVHYDVFAYTTVKTKEILGILHFQTRDFVMQKNGKKE